MVVVVVGIQANPPFSVGVPPCPGDFNRVITDRAICGGTGSRDTAAISTRSDPAHLEDSVFEVEALEEKLIHRHDVNSLR